MHSIQGYVSGRVQGVGFRYFVLLHARAAGVTGFARNLVDGRVEFLLQGEVIAVKKVLAQIHQGPSHARVDAVDLVESEPAARHQQFDIG